MPHFQISARRILVPVPQPSEVENIYVIGNAEWNIYTKNNPKAIFLHIDSNVVTLLPNYECFAIKIPLNVKIMTKININKIRITTSRMINTNTISNIKINTIMIRITLNKINTNNKMITKEKIHINPQL